MALQFLKTPHPTSLTLSHLPPLGKAIIHALSDMLTDGSVIETLAELKQKDKSLWQTIKDAVADLLRRWGEVLGVYEGRRLETAEARALNGMQEAFKKLQKMYAEAFAEANEVEANIGGELAVISDNSNNRYQQRTLSYDELVAKDDLHGVVIKESAVSDCKIVKQTAERVRHRSKIRCRFFDTNPCK